MALFGFSSRRAFLQALLVTLLALGNLGAAPGDAAGIVLYHRDGERVYLLLADHTGNSRGWAGFGGGREAAETPAQTAARETEEETRGYFKRADLLAKIKDQQPVFDGDFALFFVEVEPVPTAQISSHPLPADAKESSRERGPWAWVPLSEILGHLTTRPGPHTVAKLDHVLIPEKSSRHIWPVWLHNLYVASAAERLPWRGTP